MGSICIHDGAGHSHDPGQQECWFYKCDTFWKYKKCLQIVSQRWITFALFDSTFTYLNETSVIKILILKIQIQLVFISNLSEKNPNMSFNFRLNIPWYKSTECRLGNQSIWIKDLLRRLKSHALSQLIKICYEPDLSEISHRFQSIVKYLHLKHNFNFVPISNDQIAIAIFVFYFIPEFMLHNIPHCMYAKCEDSLFKLLRQ